MLSISSSPESTDCFFVHTRCYRSCATPINTTCPSFPTACQQIVGCMQRWAGWCLQRPLHLRIALGWPLGLGCILIRLQASCIQHLLP